MTQSIVIEGGGTTFAILVNDRGGPQLHYWGPSNAFDQNAHRHFPPLPSNADIRIERELFPLEGAGFFGEPALSAHKNRQATFSLELEEQNASDHSAQLTYTDQLSHVRVLLSFSLDTNGVLSSTTQITNDAPGLLHLQRLNAITLPLPRAINCVDVTYGSWSNEGYGERLPLVAGKLERTGRNGRPGFDGGPHLLITSHDTNERHGAAIGLALATSGGFCLGSERLSSGETQAYATEFLHPGEVILSEGESYQSPVAYAAMSENGLSALSRQFHGLARATAPSNGPARPVQLNSWEAAYFDVNDQSMRKLANDAANIGVERFVLDDGWFKGRDSDRKALGDWQPDSKKFPDGLLPLARHVRSLGMEFGLWFEPEMINEDSDLFRRHPDWALSLSGSPGPTARNQLVLDLSNPEVSEYLFSAVSTMISENDLKYIKWDCNRDLFPICDRNGSALRRQVTALYALLARLKTKHPDVSFESCASGGARIDFGILQFADRFWTSDSTDPFQRSRIQRRTSVFYPVEMLGAHAGASPNHFTNRSSSMSFRCLVALFSHFGVELNPGLLNAYDQGILRKAIALYKEHRSIITDGVLDRIECHDPGLDVQAIHQSDGDAVLLRVLRIDEPSRPSLAPVCVPTLAQDTVWHVRELFLDGANDDVSLGRRTGASLALEGGDFNCQHAGEGRLFLMERTQ
ncbi:MAG: alpha-galactosidase [Pseudomonadota bacterium]